MTVIEARGLRKAYGATIALDGVNLRLDEGRILGLIGPNGAGKSTALNAILGLTQYLGELRVLGRHPWNERDQLMRDVCFIADVAVLPRWMRVSQALDYVAGVPPRFDRAKAEGFLAKTAINRGSKVRELSKGMVTQLHLALVMAIDARLLVVDEPTLGLEILYRKQFYDSLLNDYFDRSRTIVVTTHQVEEVSPRFAANRARGHVGHDADAANVLGGATRIVGKPFGLYRAAGGRRPRAARLLDQCDQSAAQHTCRVGTRSGAAARGNREAVRHRGDADHPDCVHRRRVLLSRRAARRTPRSQHPVLEVVAGFGSHDGALEGEHSA